MSPKPRRQISKVIFKIQAFAEETNTEKTAALADKTENTVKKAVRSTKDKVCKMMDGEMKCVAKKIKHKAQNISDDASQKIKEIKNKVD